jgi:predicted O-methyltransferase YrrM
VARLPSARFAAPFPCVRWAEQSQDCQKGFIMNPVLQEIYATNLTTTPDGGMASIAGESIGLNEAEFLTQIITELKPIVTLECGLAFGMSAMVICDALQKIASSRHIVMDPFQNRQPWVGIGLHNLRQAGFEQMVEFYEASSYTILPQLHRMGGKIDFAFIDGAHQFDFVLVDFFYVDKMLPQGGIVVFDDADWPSIRRVIRYIVTNLPYSVYRTLPHHLIEKSPQRRVYEGSLSLGSFVLNGISRFPGLSGPITRAFGAELLGTDKKYGLNGSIIALRKDGEDKRKTDYHIEF